MIQKAGDSPVFARWLKNTGAHIPGSQGVPFCDNFYAINSRAEVQHKTEATKGYAAFEPIIGSCFLIPVQHRELCPAIDSCH
jgi:hypothetical protein